MPDSMPELHASEVWRNWALFAAAFFGLLLAGWRGLAADRLSKASQSQAEIARRTHTTEVFKDAVSQLSDERLEIRLGAIFTLQQISTDFPEFEHYVFQVLNAYVRERTENADPAEQMGRDIDAILRFIREKFST